MPNFTKEQQEAIDKEGMNILVSAGAGSGKTAVLTERVLRKIKQGVSISELLILTFTNKAALEMKDRIRKKLQKENLLDQLDLIDSSYITTFDAFSLSVVKKYADLLHISKNIKIAENTILKLKKKELLEEIFEEYYKDPTEEFKQMISFFCLKDDKKLQEKILALDEKLELELDKEAILKNYCKEFYQDEKISSFIDDYLNLIINKKNELIDAWQTLLSLAEDKYLKKIETLMIPLIQSNTYIKMKKNSDIKIPRLPNNSSEELKCQKEHVVELLANFQELLIYEDEDQIKSSMKKSKSTISVILEILQKLQKRFTTYKHENEFFTFMDIEKMAIELVRDHKEVNQELKDKFQEILIDEYQDTNDIQETFINYIAKDNVYMVGDIKQSIYRFRNANPMIFKNKYDNYKKGNGGYVIDLAKNFRSRREVLEDINMLFSCIMDDEIGGASYNQGHAMIFGNTNYETTAATKDNHTMELISYDASDKTSTKVEKEAFLIADDIKKKISKGYLVYDKEEDKLRQIKYQDFAILLDRATDFNTYQQIFEYLGIPLTLWQNESANSSFDLYLLKNFFQLITKIAQSQYDEEFFFAFTSLARSFLFQMDDKEIYDSIINKNYKETTIYQIFNLLAKDYNTLTPSLFLEKVLQLTDYREKLIFIGNVKIMTSRMEYFYNLVKQLEKSGYTMLDVTKYFQDVIASKFDIELAMSKPESNSVKMMTIHKSKGLEYPICYFAGFTTKFNDGDYKESVLYDRKYGIIIPDLESNQNLITRTMMLHKLKLDDIGEKIRLFYVALTRAREKIIVIMPKEEETIMLSEKVDSSTRLKYTSFESIMKSLYSILLDRVYEIKTIPGFNKDYLKPKEIELTSLEKKSTININKSVYNKTLLEKHKFSKEDKNTKPDEKLLQLGSKIHELLERCDLERKVIPQIDDPFIQKKIMSFVNSKFLEEHKNKKIYQEYEFYIQDGSKINHGIIDLLLVGDKEVTIIDYKLKNTIDLAYKEQLSGYKSVITTKLQLPTTCYLYSILDETFTLVDC